MNIETLGDGGKIVTFSDHVNSLPGSGDLADGRLASGHAHRLEFLDHHVVRIAAVAGNQEMEIFLLDLDLTEQRPVMLVGFGKQLLVDRRVGFIRIDQGPQRRPGRLIELARDSGLAAVALTDHDTVAGCAEAEAVASRVGIRFVPGVEISAQYQPGTMHILGLFIDYRNRQLLEELQRILAGRNNRNPRIVANLRNFGIDVTMEEWAAEAGGEVLGRPHLAAVMVRKAYVRSKQEAFDKYLAKGASCYVDRMRLSPADSIELIHAAGGLAILSHPIQLRYTDDAHCERIVKDLVAKGLDGIEIYHSDHEPHHIRLYRHLAEKYNLLTSGGSDFHGERKKDIRLGVFVNKKKTVKA